MLPVGMERIYRVLNGDSKNSEGLDSNLKEYAPTIRDVSLFNGLNKWLRTVELQTGLAYGTISDVNEGEDGIRNCCIETTLSIHGQRVTVGS